MVWDDVRRAAFRAEARIKIRMPVDTGRARASWGHYSPADVKSLESGSNAADAFWVEDEDNLTIIEGSNVEYIEYLNEGSSTQAPAGFIDTEEQAAGDYLAELIADDLEALWGSSLL